MRITDVHPDDLAHRRELVAATRAARIAAGYDLVTFGERLGLDFRAVSRWECRPRPNPYIAGVQRRARAAHHRAVFTLDGLPDAELGDDMYTQMLRTMAQSSDPERADAGARALLRAQLVAARHAAGLSLRDVGVWLGTSPKAVGLIENGDEHEPIMATFQHLARAYGGVLRGELHQVFEPAPRILTAAA